MKRLVALLATAFLVATGTPAYADGGGGPITVVTPAPTVRSGPTCPGAADATWVNYEFSEPAGSTVFHATGLGSAYNLTAQSFGGTPAANGTSVTFHENSLLRTAGNVFNPEDNDYVVCVGFRMLDDQDGYNLWQVGNSHVPPSALGFLKMTGWYGQFQSVDRRWKVNTDVVGRSLNGTGWHTITMVRHSDYFNYYLDGESFGPIRQVGVGPIHLDQVMSLGGKVEANGSQTSTHDLCDCSVAWLRLGVN